MQQFALRNFKGRVCFLLNTHHTQTPSNHHQIWMKRNNQRVNLLEQVMIHRFRAIWSKFVKFLMARRIELGTQRIRGTRRIRHQNIVQKYTSAVHQEGATHIALCIVPFYRRLLEAFPVSKLGAR